MRYSTSILQTTLSKRSLRIKTDEEFSLKPCISQWQSNNEASISRYSKTSLTTRLSDGLCLSKVCASSYSPSSTHPIGLSAGNVCNINLLNQRCAELIQAKLRKPVLTVPDFGHRVEQSPDTGAESLASFSGTVLATVRDGNFGWSRWTTTSKVPDIKIAGLEKLHWDIFRSWSINLSPQYTDLEIKIAYGQTKWYRWDARTGIYGVLNGYTLLYTMK